MTVKPFKILSIDGGGIRGITPARLLCELENELRMAGRGPGLHNYFDMMCGTSTGGIIALGLALGMPAQEILDLYKENAHNIFKSHLLRLGIFKPLYDSESLEGLLKEAFAKYSGDGDTRLWHSKTRVCIPTFNAELGKAHIYKTPHHEGLIRDYQIPAYQVAMSTAAAPIFFSPYSFSYSHKGSNNLIRVSMNIDGAVIANNPTQIGIMEALHTLKVPIDQLKVLSLGTGHTKFSESDVTKKFGFFYWSNRKVRLTDLMFSAQSQNTDNLIKFLNYGIGEGQPSQFYYKRVQHFFAKNEDIRMDEIQPVELAKLESIAVNAYKENGEEIYSQFLNEVKHDYKPNKQI